MVTTANWLAWELLTASCNVLTPSRKNIDNYVQFSTPLGLVSKLVSGSPVWVVVIRPETGKQMARPEGLEPPTLASEVWGWWVRHHPPLPADARFFRISAMPIFANIRLCSSALVSGLVSGGLA
jgi:hypothetical protein